MRTTLAVLLLACGGCSVAPTSELGDLYTEHAQCLDTGAIGCERMWEEIERRERIAVNRERERERECPGGTVGVGNVYGPANCLSHAEVHSVLSRMLR